MKHLISIISIILVSLSHSFAIEGLTISLQCTNVVLRWPSIEGETYIVQHRATLNTNDTWETLTNFYPAFIGTNRTTFIHADQVTCIQNNFSGGGGTGGGGPPSPSSATAQTTDEESGSKKKEKKEKELPPFPWDQSTWAKSSTTYSAESNGPESASGGAAMEMGFYRVVRNGVFIVGVTNGTTIGGQIPLAIEVALGDEESASGFAITAEDGEAIQGIETLSITNGRLEATWDTTLAENGNYALAPILYLGLETSVTGAVKTVTVHNDIRFPTGFPLAEQAMRIEARTIHTNGTWTMNFFDDTGFNGLSLSGDVDGNGFCNYPGIPGPGFSVGLNDASGNQIPTEYILAVVTTFPSGVSASAGGASATGTNKIFLEQAWNSATKYVVAYIPIYQQYTQADSDLFAMMAHVVAQCRLRWDYTVQDSVINSPPAGTPFRLRFPTNWIQLTVDMKTRQPIGGFRIVRNFFYFGHGGPKHIGYTNDNLQLSEERLKILLGNDSSAKTNAQPFRFVFLDGCETSKGNLCKAFGIPKKTVTSAEFTAARGLRPRAFVGWPNRKVIGVAGILNQTHKQFIENFYDQWPRLDDQGRPLTLRVALDNAAINPDTGGKFTSLDEEAKIYGSSDLTFYEN